MIKRLLPLVVCYSVLPLLILEFFFVILLLERVLKLLILEFLFVILLSERVLLLLVREIALVDVLVVRVSVGSITLIVRVVEQSLVVVDIVPVLIQLIEVLIVFGVAHIAEHIVLVE